jgi:hypothetical protein
MAIQKDGAADHPIHRPTFIQSDVLRLAYPRSGAGAGGGGGGAAGHASVARMTEPSAQVWVAAGAGAGAGATGRAAGIGAERRGLKSIVAPR